MAALLAVALATSAPILLSRWALSPAPEGARARWGYVLDGQSMAGERSARAANLLATGLLDSVICGGNPVGGDISGATLSARRVLSLSQADPARIAEFRLAASSTLDEARALVPLLRALGADTIALVTSDFHTRRALSVFRRVAGPYPVFVAFAARGPDFPDSWWRFRNGRRTWLIETAKNAYWHVFEKWSVDPLPDDAPILPGSLIRAPEAGMLPGAAPCPVHSVSPAPRPVAAPTAPDSVAPRPDSAPAPPDPLPVAREAAVPAATAKPPAKAPGAGKTVSAAGAASTRKAATGTTASTKSAGSASGRKVAGDASKSSAARGSKSAANDRKR